jgi:hypothetical protein
MVNGNKNTGWVYLIHAVGTNRYKIGKTFDIERRLTELSYQSPYPLERVLEFETLYPSTDEKILHKKFASNRVCGEWFEFEQVNLEHFFPLATYRRLAMDYLRRLFLCTDSDDLQARKTMVLCIVRCDKALKAKNEDNSELFKTIYKLLNEILVKHKQDIRQGMSRDVSASINELLLFWLRNQERIDSLRISDVK